MNSIDLFPFLISYILGELEDDSWIQIEYETVEDEGAAGPYNPPIRVVAVNGANTAFQFMQRLRNLKAGVLEKLCMTIPQIDPAHRNIFLDMVLQNLMQIMNSVMLEELEHPTGLFDGDIYWAIEVMECYQKDKLCDDTIVYVDAMAQTVRQAWIFYLELKRLVEHIQWMAVTSLSMPDIYQIGAAVKPVNKIRLNCSVAFLGTLLRVACDRNLIEVKNVSELCRWVSENFCTQRQDNLSPHSIRNHFDHPSSEALDQVNQELQVWGKYLVKLSQQLQL